VRSEIRCALDLIARSTAQTKLAYIPDGFRHTNVGQIVEYDENAILEREGDLFVARVNDFNAADRKHLNHIHIQQEKRYVRPADVLPVILAYRRSIMEVSSKAEPYLLKAGDNVFLLGGDGYAGSYQCVLPTYGRPVSAKILGAIINPRTQKPGRLADFGPVSFPAFKATHRPAVVAVLGVRMDCGKSTTIIQLTRILSRSGYAIAAGKIAGFGCFYETKDLNPNFSIDFTDFGLPSTCGPDVKKVVEAADWILGTLRAQNPDIIFLEFGGDLIGPYRVIEIMEHVKRQVDFTIFVTFDLCGLKGGITQLESMGCKIDLVTGPLVNTSLGMDLVNQWFDLPSESNQADMTTTAAAIEGLIRSI
jgi:hypothetical protein